MKGSCTLVASFLAASTAALSSSSSAGERDVTFSRSSNPQQFCELASPSDERVESKNRGGKPSDTSERFAPRFDGLRFIETLVTAHR